MKNRKAEEKGITLIALIITVIILLILAGVAISSLGNSGLFSKSKDAVNKYSEAEKNEADELANYLNELENQSKPPVEVPSGFIPIYTRADLEKVGSGVQGYTIKGKTYNMNNDAKYVLMNNIDLSGTDWVALPEFNGVFDGNYNKIKNLTVNTSTETYSGLFSIIKDGSVNKVAIDNCNIINTKAGAYVGGIAAYTEWPDLYNYTMDQVYVTGYLEANDGYAGGLVGYHKNHYMEVTNSYNEATVKSENGNAGGLVGSLHSGHYHYSYSVGKVIGANLKSGGLVGERITPDNTILSCHWYDEVGSLSEGIGIDHDTYRTQTVDEITEVEMKTKSTFVGFDFDNIWKINDGSSYPKLSGFNN